jgi:GDP-L-fucose synthase
MNKRVVVTGGSGFLGSHVVEKFKYMGSTVLVPTVEGYDLRRRENISHMLKDMQPQVIIHLAAVCGGIGANMAQPARFFYDNLVMGAELIDMANTYGIEKFVQVGTVCAYPKNPPLPFKEEDLWNGYPEETNAPYGLAKKALLVQCQAYRAQYGMNAIYLLPVNLYGERDNFDLHSSHVMPALIRKCFEAKLKGADSITVWGTGKASREFLYAGDCAEALYLATERYNSPEPINLGSGSEVTMRDLVELIKKAVGFEGKIVYDSSKPDGQPRRCLDVSKAISAFGFRARTSLEEGIRKTVEWYTTNHSSNI